MADTDDTRGAFYFHGDKGIYTGRTQFLHGATCYEYQLVEGHHAGELGWTYCGPQGNAFPKQVQS